MRLNSAEILSAISQKPIGSGTEAATYDAARKLYASNYQNIALQPHSK